MKPNVLRAISVGTLMFVFVDPRTPAQNADAPPDVKAFAAQCVAAWNARDKTRLESLFISQSRACITPANHDVYDAMRSMQMRDSVPSNYQLSFTTVNEANLKAIETQATFPAKPERELHIDYQYPNSNDAGGIDIWLVRRDGRWMSDFLCMNASLIQSYRANAGARAHYRALADAIGEPLRSQLLAMLRTHQKGEAETRYQRVKGGGHA